MKKLKDLWNNFLGGFWLITIFFACFNPTKKWIVNAVVVSLYGIPLFIKMMKEGK